jgi:peptidoglycan hydrolase-like protein with peptidoglycan-binding domain
MPPKVGQSPVAQPRKPASAPDAEPLLSKGSAGPKVTDLQLALTKAGYDTKGVDGEFGKDTRAALVKFQGDHNLTPDGIAGRLTMKALAAAPASPNARGWTAPKTGPAQAAAKIGDAFQAGAGKYEITKDHKYSASDLAHIRKTNPALASSIHQAQTSYASLLNQGAKITATTSAGNGNKPVLTVIPPSLANNADASKPYSTEVHYHGMYSTAGAPNASSPLTSRISDSFKKDPPTVYVLPDWKGTNDWSNVSNTGTTAQDATRGIVGASAQTTVSAHSLGRQAVLSAITKGGLVADRLDIQDAFYSTQASGPAAVSQWARAHPNAQVRVLTTTTGAMSDMPTIKRQGQPWPSNVTFSDQSRKQNHWAADLMPW